MSFCPETYLRKLRELTDRGVEGGYGNDRPQRRLELRLLLREMGCDPAGGLPSDAELGIPPGIAPGLDADERLNLVIDTQVSLRFGRGQRERGLESAGSHPAWELVRVSSRHIPRVGAGLKGWTQRWMEAEGPTPVIDRRTGEARLIALKEDEIWDRLGDSDLFGDALDVNHPPFASGSGMGWRALSRCDYEEATGLQAPPQPPSELPKGLTPELVARLLALDTPECRAELKRRMKGAHPAGQGRPTGPTRWDGSDRWDESDGRRG